MPPKSALASSNFGNSKEPANSLLATNCIIVELVDLQLLTANDRTECYFELRWGSGMPPVRSQIQKPVNGICTFTERLRMQVPNIGARRNLMELHLVGVNPLLPLGWCTVPATDLLSGKRLRQAVHLKAPGSATDPTAYVLQAAYFYAEDASAMLRPAEVPISDSYGNALFTNVRNTGGGFSDTGTMLGLGGLSTSTVSFNNSASAVAQALMNAMQRPKVSASTQTDLSGPVVAESELHRYVGRDAIVSGSNNILSPPSLSSQHPRSFSLLQHGHSPAPASSSSRSPSVTVSGKMNAKAANDIRDGFANFDRTRERSNTTAGHIEEAIAQQQLVKDNVGDAPFLLRKPIDLLVMKRSVAAWPRDEIEGLITYGEQMKSYANTLEKQNAKLVIHQMRDAVAELRDLGNNSRSISGNPHQMANRSNSMPAGMRSSSTTVNNFHPANQNNNNNNNNNNSPPGTANQNRSLSQFSERLFSAGNGFNGNNNNNNNSNNYYGDDVDNNDELPNVHNFEEVNGFYPPSSMMNRNSNRARNGSPEFVTRIEMNRGVPLEDTDRSHVMNHFGDL